MRRASLAAAGLLALGLVGCASEEKNNFEDRDRSLEAWVAPYDQVVRRHDFLDDQAYLDLQSGPELTLSSLRVVRGAPAFLRAGAAVLVVIEGEGQATSSAGEARLGPGAILALPDGAGVKVSSKDMMRGVVFASTRSASGAWQLFELEQLPIASERPGSAAEIVRLEGALSLRLLTVFPLGGLPPHVHLLHDSAAVFLSGEGMLGFGSEAAGDGPNESKGDRKLKRNFIATPISDQALVFIPRRSVHSFTGEGRERTLILQVFSPSFDGKDGFVIPERRAD